jgi:hypothetical protein
LVSRKFRNKPLARIDKGGSDHIHSENTHAMASAWLRYTWPDEFGNRKMRTVFDSRIQKWIHLSKARSGAPYASSSVSGRNGVG